MLSSWVDGVVGALMGAPTKVRFVIFLTLSSLFVGLVLSLLFASLRVQHYRKIAIDLRGQLIAHAAQSATKKADEYMAHLKEYLRGVEATDALSRKKKEEIKAAIENRVKTLKERKDKLRKEMERTEKKDIHALLRQAQELETELRKP